MPPFCEEHQMYHDQFGECQIMRVIARRQAKDAALREKAERIAKNIPLPATWRAGVEMTPALQDEIVAYGTAATLQALIKGDARTGARHAQENLRAALTEKENA